MGTYCILTNATAQTSRIEYTTILQLNPGEQINNLLTCWVPDEQAAPSRIVIQQPGGSYAMITGGIRKDNLTQQQIYDAPPCKYYDPFKPPKDSHLQFGRLLPNGKWNIRTEKKDYGTYDNIHYMRESGNRFVAVVSVEKKQFFFINSDGQKTLLDGRPESLITNRDLSRSAVVLASAQGPSIEEVNKMSKDDQAAFYEKKHHELSRQVWLNDNSTFTVMRDSRLYFDMSGRHFIEIQPKAFYIDGKPCQRNISGGGTQLFVSQDGSDWAYFYLIYLSFKNNTNIQNAFNPFLTTEDGKEYLNWFMVQKENNSTVLRHAKRQWR